MKDIKNSLFAVALLLMIPANLMAQGTSTQASQRNGKWLKNQGINLKDEVDAYENRNSTEETSEFTELRGAFTQQFDFNEMIRERMAWDKNLSSDKSYFDRCHLSLGVIKVDKLMGGAMLKVRLFN